uniref:Uncharacterized protein n=1 Tax=Rhizophora mucronata TaxID=61149 RepID=A0A2P2PSH0_RHIMU
MRCHACYLIPSPFFLVVDPFFLSNPSLHHP